MGFRLWVSRDKRMVAWYTDKACVDIFLEKEDVNIPGDKVRLEFYEGERLLEVRYVDVESEFSLDEIIDFLRRFE